MEQLTIVEYKGDTIRVYGARHNPLFSGEDVARVLGYSVCADAMRKVDAEDKVDKLITEFGLFTLISLRHVTEFKRFATHEMLPQIHKSGKCKKAKSPNDRKKYERLYELSNGEKVTKVELSYRAITLGMPKTEAKRNSASVLTRYINEKHEAVAEKEFFENAKADYRYSYDYLDELCSNNLSTLLRLLPESSYVTYKGKTRFNEQAVEIIKNEISKWK